MNTRTQPRPLGNVEQRVMDHVWSNGPVTADACRQALASVWPMKESTVRTVLRRLCLLYTSDAADERSSVDLGGRRIIKKKKKQRRQTLAAIDRGDTY